MSAAEKYEASKFYWVMIVLDPDAANEWENQTVPARFAGYSETGEEVWNFLDPDTTAWPVRWSMPIAPPVAAGSVDKPSYVCLREGRDEWRQRAEKAEADLAEARAEINVRQNSISFWIARVNGLEAELAAAKRKV